MKKTNYIAMELNNKKSILIAAGASGGHLFSASGISSELNKRGYQILLLTDNRVKDLLVNFPAEKIIIIPSDTFTNKSPLKWPMAFFKLVLGFFISFFWIIKMRCVLAIGLGGYPSVAPLIAAKFCGLRMLIHEQNRILGRANYFLLPLADLVTKGFDDKGIVPKKYCHKVKFSGNPVREEILNFKSTKKNIQKEKFNILIFGGSQGASYFTSLIPKVLDELPSKTLNNLKLIQQVRKEDISILEENYSKRKISYLVKDFFYNLPEIISKADLIISRSGASTISEMAVIGKPCIFIPLNNTLDGDQEYNAKRLDEYGAAIVFNQINLKPYKLSKKIEELISNPQNLNALSSKIKKFGFADASENIAKFSENLIRR
ncbi:MAG: undecaprenyldiphospho-muramoylpentapeptide beta-N-acetylglucosaminyltransferase [Pseudomonadota bacterium]|nr:undecaprenyldiphospho-muramoylpentapeptide beta-N-acetylglucosaminyltransferase [Pseudomonadota bacterium]